MYSILSMYLSMYLMGISALEVCLCSLTFDILLVKISS